PGAASENPFQAPFRGIAAEMIKAELIGKAFSPDRSSADKGVRMFFQNWPWSGPRRVPDFAARKIASRFGAVAPRKLTLPRQQFPFSGPRQAITLGGVEPPTFALVFCQPVAELTRVIPIHADNGIIVSLREAGRVP